MGFNEQLADLPTLAIDCRAFSKLQDEDGGLATLHGSGMGTSLRSCLVPLVFLPVALSPRVTFRSSHPPHSTRQEVLSRQSS